MKSDSNAPAPLALFALALFASVINFAAPPVAAARTQKPKGVAAATPAQPPALKRTTTRREVRRFGFGNTLTIYGAPEGSITVEAWARPEIEITADVELRANTEEELTLLAAVNGFALDEDATHFQVVTTGTHDRQFMKRAAKELAAAKNFPKHLLAMPWRVDYHIRVPAVVDLEVFAGKGALVFDRIEGSLQLKAGESSAALTLSGGDVSATLVGGSVLLRVTERSWRGRGVNVRMATGQLTVALPAGFNGEVSATVVRAGRVENADAVLGAGDERASSSSSANERRSVKRRAGAGGAPFTFEVGDGVIRFVRLGAVERAKP